MVALLAFGGVAYAAYIVMAIGVGRAKRTQFNWVIAGGAALISISLNLLLVPDHGMMGSAVAAAAAYSGMFLGMTWYAQRVYPTPYQWRRVFTAAGAAVALTVAGKLLDVPLAVALVLVLAYPLALLALGFFLPEERRALSAPRTVRQESHVIFRITSVIARPIKGSAIRRPSATASALRTTPSETKPSTRAWLPSATSAGLAEPAPGAQTHLGRDLVPGESAPLRRGRPPRGRRCPPG